MLLRMPFSQSPGRLLILSVFGIILLGSLLLALPCAQIIPHAFIDLLFTAASATCVTGLLTVPLAEFTLFGKAIILILIQIGGLGLITMTVFLMSLFVQVGMKTHLMAGQLLELDTWNNSKKMIKFITLLTFTAELLGALVLWCIISPEQSSDPLWFTALFHAISSFCSAGFSIFPEGMQIFTHNAPFLLVTMGLLIIGELGFITWHELARAAKATYQKKWFKLSLHTKIVLSYSSMLTMSTTLALWLLEGPALLTHESPGYAFLNTIFNAISFRSCGFTTANLALFQCVTFLLIMVVSFIGVSPGSTGSGIKVTSLALLVATIKSIMTGRSVVEIRERRIPHEQVFKALAIVTLALAWILATTALLLITEQNPTCSFLPYVFEAVSAFANLGISLGLTPFLSSAGKIIIMVSMLIGRIGALTLILAIKTHKDTGDFQYPEERVMLS
jgi:trk system potassium uptake protein TrkH